MTAARFIKIHLCILIIFTAAVLADKPEYYAAMMDGKKIGYAVMTREIENDKIRTGQELTITISRMGVEMTAQCIESYIETLDAIPLGFESKMSVSGMMDSGSKGKIIPGNKMEVYVFAGGMGTTQILDYPEGTLMAEGVLNIQKKRGLKTGDKFKTKCFIPSMLTAATVEVETFNEEKIELFGTAANAVKQIIRTNINGQEIVTTEYVDTNMKILKSIMPSMGINIELVACDKKIALSRNELVDVLYKTLVQCPVTLPDRDKLKSITYYIKSNDKNIELLFPTDQSQSVMHKDGLTIVKIAKTIPNSVQPLKYSGTDEEILQALQPSQFIQSDNELIIKLAKQAIGNTQDVSEAIFKIEEFVGDYIIDKNMSVGYASAAEVAQSMQGDCTEHAVLTAALCRAVGIPAKVAVGLVYVEELGDRKNVFGGHAWTEAYVGDKWIGLDATRGYGPGHIKMASGMGDPGDFIEMMNLLGSFDIKKVDIEK